LTSRRKKKRRRALLRSEKVTGIECGRSTDGKVRFYGGPQNDIGESPSTRRVKPTFMGAIKKTVDYYPPKPQVMIPK
jgi:hypothetical protein